MSANAGRIISLNNDCPEREMKEREHLGLRNAEDRHWFYAGKREIACHWLNHLGGKKLLIQKDARVLDIGCGSGILIRDFQAMVKWIGGVEVSSIALQNIRNEALGQIARASAIELPFADGSFDVVTCFDVIEHLENDAGGIREISRVLKNGGMVMLNVPAYQWLWSDWDVSVGHFRRYSRRELAALLVRCGFHVYRASYENAVGLLPAILLRKSRQFLGISGLRMENVIPPFWINYLLNRSYVLAACGLSGWIPFGLSVWGIAQKPSPEPGTS